MFEINSENARQYLVDSGRISADQPLSVTRLCGGVSNEVLLVESASPAGPRMVLKQARPRLRTPMAWFCTIERIWREVEVLTVCRQFAPAGQIPEILFEDRDNYLYAMTAAPARHAVWRDELLSGRIDPAIARDSGRLLAALHSGGWKNEGLALALADREIFRQLRIEPYYETVAAQHPADRALLDRLIDHIWDRPSTLVHADFSPKNLLVSAGQIMLVDFETGHYGNPAFDLGFFLTHLVLKAFYHAPQYAGTLSLIDDFWAGYLPAMQGTLSADECENLIAGGIENLAGCLWSRVDGKSQVDYLTDPDRRASVRLLARTMLIEQPRNWPVAAGHIEVSLAAIES